MYTIHSRLVHKDQKKEKKEILIFPTFFIFHVGQSFTTFLESFVTKIEITEEKMKDRRKENCVWSHAYPVVTLIQWSSQRPMCHFTPKPSHDVDAIITMVKCGNSERQTCQIRILDNSISEMKKTQLFQLTKEV